MQETSRIRRSESHEHTCFDEGTDPKIIVVHFQLVDFLEMLSKVSWKECPIRSIMDKDFRVDFLILSRQKRVSPWTLNFLNL